MTYEQLYRFTNVYKYLFMNIQIINILILFYLIANDIFQLH